MLDSLQLVLNNSKNDSVKVILLLDMADKSEPKEALNFLDQAEKIAVHLPLTFFQIGEIYYQKGYSFGALRDKDNAIISFKEAAKYYVRTDSFSALSNCYFNIANDLANSKNSLSASIEYFEKSYLIRDSIQNIPKAIEASTRLAQVYARSGDVKNALSFLEKSEDYLLNLNDKKLLRSFYDEAAYVNEIIGELDKAKRYQEKCVQLYEVSKDTLNWAKKLFNLGVIYQRQGDMDSTMIIYNKVFQLFKKVDFHQGEVIILNNLSALKSNLKQYDEALEYLYEVNQLIIENKAPEGELLKTDANCSLNIGMVLFKKGSLNLEEALKWYIRADSLYALIPDRIGGNKAKMNIGGLYYKQEKYDEAINVLSEAIKNSTILKTEKSSTIAMTSLGMSYFRVGDYGKAETNFLRAEALLKNAKMFKEELYLYRSLAEFYDSTKNYKKNAVYLNKVVAIKDTIYNRDKNELTQEYNKKYELGRKEKKIASQGLTIRDAQKENAKKTTFLLFAMFGLSIAVFIAFIYYRDNKRKAKNNHKLHQGIKRLEKLLVGLKHHTNGQFNTAAYFLHTKRRLTEDKNVSAALLDAENLFHYIVTINKNLELDSKSSLQKSIATIAQNLKFGADSLSGKELELDISIPLLNTSDTNNLTMGTIITELMTNSIKYAFDKQDDPKIELKIEKDTNAGINFQYRDNGIGHKIHDITSGKGLAIIKDMIEQLYGEHNITTNDGFFFEATFPKFIKDE